MKYSIAAWMIIMVGWCGVTTGSDGPLFAHERWAGAAPEIRSGPFNSFGDLNGDGVDDCLYYIRSNEFSGAGVLWGLADGGFVPAGLYDSGEGGQLSRIGADTDGDGLRELNWVLPGSSLVVREFGPDGVLGEPRFALLPYPTVQVESLSDLDANGTQDWLLRGVEYLPKIHISYAVVLTSPDGSLSQPVLVPQFTQMRFANFLE